MSRTDHGIAVVTGGASGIGQECVRQLRDDGWRVVVWDRSEKNDNVSVDIADYASVSVAAKRLDRVDLLVNAGGIAWMRCSPMQRARH